MNGFDDHVSITGDWMPPNQSPRSFFSSMTNDDAFVRSFGDTGNENRSASAGFDKASNSNVVTEPKMMSTRGGLMERIAARAGFNAPRLNTESIRHGDLSKEQEVRSPYLTIPPGLSPTTLLESPVFLTNSLVPPSPTTGKFAFAPSGNNRNFSLMRDDLDKLKENTFEDTTSFAFKPIAESISVPNLFVKNKVHASSSFPTFGVSIRSDTSFPHQSIEPPKFQISNSHAEKNGPDSKLSPDQSYQSIGLVDNSPPPDEPRDDDDGDQKSGEDGYNWRKYGQKHVKGSEYPRSYYKCTSPNCPVKKKVERSHEGHITEIIYKGAHTHPKPPPSRRSSNSLGEMPLASEQPVWSAVQNNVETTSSARSLVEYGNGANMQAQNGSSQYESGDGVDGSSTLSNDEDDEDDRATHGSVSLGYDGEGDESDLKRRRIEAYASEMSGATRAIREPRVVVQTTSDVDILDDGYRWRKYGQKVVKGNPNPRSYYKCTSAGCNVRKHVERASHDLKSVITTYEGKHNHDVPAARNSSHINSGTPNTLPNQQAPSAVSSHMKRAEPSQIRTSMGRYERPSLGSFGLPGMPPQFGPGIGFGLPVMPVHTYLGHRPQHMNEMGFVLPKPEPKLEPVTDSGLNTSDGSSVYQQLMSRLPLGPQM